MRTLSMFFHSLLLTIIGLTLALLPVGEIRAQANAEQRRHDALNQSASGSNVPSNVPRSAEESATGVYYDSEGYAVKTVEVKTKSLAMSTDFLTLVMMLGIGVFIGRIIKYPRKSKDTWVAIAAATIMVGSTIMAIMGSRSRIHAQDYKIDIREDGTVNNMQTDAIREQIKSYRELESLSGKKWKIEAAGATAYFAASAYALMQHVQTDAQLLACNSALTAAIATATPICASTLNPAAPEACRQVAACQAAQVELSRLHTSFMNPASTPSMPEGSMLTTQTLSASAAASMCTPAASCGAVIGSADLTLTYGTPAVAVGAHLSPRLDQGLLKIVNQQHHLKLWDNDLEFNSPYDNLFSFLKPEVLNQGLFSLSPSLMEYEKIRFERGERNSLKTDELKKIIASSHSYAFSRIERMHERNQKQLKSLIVENLISKSHAWSAKEFGLAGGVAAAFYFATRQQSMMIDSMLATPQKRAITFGVAGTIAAASAAISKKTESTMGENAEKLEQLLGDVLKLQTSATVFTGPGQQSPGRQLGLNPSSVQLPRLAAEGEKSPCLSEGKNCTSLEDAIKSDVGVTDFGATMTNLASLSGKAADGMMGVDQLSAGTMSDLESLAGQQGVAKKLSERTMEAYNKKLKEAGKDPVDLAAITDSALRSLQAATIRSLNKDTQARDLLAAGLGMQAQAAPGEAKTALADIERETEESALAAGGGPAGVGAVSGSGFDFNFDFDDDATTSEQYADTFGLTNGMVDLQDYEAIDDIVSNRDVSLFQIITVRYFKSGFPRLFEIDE